MLLKLFKGWLTLNPNIFVYPSDGSSSSLMEILLSTEMRERLFCFNTFNEAKLSHVSKNLKLVQQWMTESVDNININCKVCANCRIKLYKLNKSTNVTEYLGEGASGFQTVQRQSAVDCSEVEDASGANFAIALLNTSLQIAGVSPIQKKCVKEKKYHKKNLRM
ncbi:hypothetical protein FQA39_LY04236 [Lamprigera yunnana]|nr:hypothetical protein FQA39_LY04236 [Lamprigera yunnana]